MKWSVEVQWHYKAFDWAVVEVEADDQEAAETQALALAPNIGDWLDGGVIEDEYSVNSDETKLLSQE